MSATVKTNRSKSTSKRIRKKVTDLVNIETSRKYHLEHLEVNMKSSPFSKRIASVTFSILLFTSFLFVGCGTSEEDNSQPLIETITDKTLNVDDELAVEVTIVDADVENSHIIRAFSDDSSVATISVRSTTLTIKGMAAGTATITISATDDSGQANAAAEPVTFEITINPPSNDLTGAWVIAAIDFQSIVIDNQIMELPLWVAIALYPIDNWTFTFNDDGTCEADWFQESERDAIQSGLWGTYSLSGSNYTITFEDSNDKWVDTGTWNRKGNTLTLNSDDGTSIVFNKE